MPTTINSTISRFNCLSEDIGKKKHDFSADTFKLALVTSAQTLTASGQSVYSDITAELANGNGYTTGGLTLTASFSRTDSVSTFDFSDAVLTATGAITARQYVIYNNTHASKPLVCFGSINSADIDVELVSGEVLTIIPNVSGLFFIGY